MADPLTFMQALGSSAGGAIGNATGSVFGDIWGSATNTRQIGTSTTSGTKTTQKVLSEEAVQQLIYQAMSSDKGLAAILSSQGMAGGRNSSSATLQAQDFMTKLIGELAAVTAPTVETGESSTTTQQKKKVTVICTELARQGLLDPELYEAGGPPSVQVSYETWVGYHCWATKVVPLMAVSPRLSAFLLPIVRSRYLYITGRSFWQPLGWLTVYVGEPVCKMIGRKVLRRGTYGAAEFS